MAVYVDQPTRSRRFIKAYLATWAVLAAAALGYLAMLAFPPQQQATVRVQVPEQDPGQAMRALAKTAIEMTTMRRSLSDIQSDVAVLKDAAAERDAKDKAVATRLTAVEERLAGLDPAAEPAGPSPSSKAKVSERQRKAGEPKVTARLITVTPEAPDTRPPPHGDDGPPVPLETGSIAPPAGEITFGEPVVTRSDPQGPISFAVQLAAGPSLQGLRQSWSQLRERHGALVALEPRVVAPRSDGGPYRLLAGPFATRADASRVCTEMGVGRSGCYVTTYIGAPL